MMHPKLRWVMFTAAIGMLACHGDPTDSLRNGGHSLRASPGSVFVGQGDSVAIVTQLLDEQGNALAADFTMTSSDPTNLPVTKDTSFLPVYDANGVLVPPTDATRARFFVKGVGLTTGTLTATSGGITQTIPVTSTASAGTNLAVGVMSNPAPALGDTVTITVPAPWKLDPAATVFGAQGAIITTGVSADSSSISFVPGPNTDTVVSIAPALLPFIDPTDPFAPPQCCDTLFTTVPLVTPVLTTVAVGFSNTTPNTNDIVTVTAPAGFKFLPNVGISFAGSAQTVESVAADSGSLTFRAQGPGNTGAPTFTNIVLDFLTIVPLTLDATTSVTVGNTVNSLAGTDAIATAPLQVIPDSGSTSILDDTGGFAASSDCGNSPGGFDCRIYKIVLPVDRTFTVDANWNNNSDIGVYFMDGTLADAGPGAACDAGGTSSPESCEVSLTAGTYYIAVVTFAVFYPPPDNVPPTAITLTLTGE